MVPRTQPLRAGLLAPLTFALLFWLDACSTFDPLDQRGETINRNATDYANDATLLNVIRAKLMEPLTFITITGLDGTQSAMGTLGFSGITLGPHQHTSPHTFIFGPNSATRSNTNTFHISVVDDPASFTALLTPVNPALIAFFVSQGYPRELLFFLFTDRLREVKKENGKITEVIAEYDNTPGKEFGPFIDKMSNLLNQGLVAQIDVTNMPTGRGLPPSKLCMDPTARPPAFGSAVRPSPPPPGGGALCDEAPWIQAQPAAGTAAPAAASGAAPSPMTVAADGTLWVLLSNQNKVVRLSSDGKTTSYELPQPPAPAKHPPSVAFEFDDGFGHHYQLFTRSTYGAYEYVGTLLREGDIANLLQPDESDYGGIVYVMPPRQTFIYEMPARQAPSGGPTPSSPVAANGNSPKNPATGNPVQGQPLASSMAKREAAARAMGCFAEVGYRDIDYCVPNTASHTKQLFALLHQLQELNTAPSNAPTTLTVTPVP
jgi:hypothetical protein